MYPVSRGFQRRRALSYAKDLSLYANGRFINDCFKKDHKIEHTYFLFHGKE